MKPVQDSIEEILSTHCTSCDKEEKQKVAKIILSLFSTIIEESKPKKIEDRYDDWEDGFNEALDQYEQNLKKLLGGGK